jgi:uncharacterized membrane protein (DUF485 family)
MTVDRPDRCGADRNGSPRHGLSASPPAVYRSASTFDEGVPVVSTTGERPTSEGTRYEQVQASPEFQDLRARMRRFVFPMSVGFLVWYLAYVLLATFAPAFMATKVVGNLTVGLFIGLLQFISTFAITTLYVSYANTKLDPAAERLRIEIEGSDR